MDALHGQVGLGGQRLDYDGSLDLPYLPDTLGSLRCGGDDLAGDEESRMVELRVAEAEAASKMLLQGGLDLLEDEFGT